MSTPIDSSAPPVAAPVEGTAPAAAPEAVAAPVAPEKPAPRRLTRQRAEAAPVAPVEAAPKGVEPERGSRVISRLKAEIERGRASVEEAKAYRDELAEYAKSALDGLPKEARAYIAKVAGDNPAKQLATVRELKAAGLLSQPSAQPANSGPKAAPPQGAKDGDSDAAALAEYERLRKVAPVLALDFMHRNRDALQRARSRN